MVASAALAHPALLDDAATNFLMRNLDLVEQHAIAKSGGALGTQIWKQDPVRFTDLLEGGERQRLVAESSIAQMDLNTLANGIARAPQLCSTILAIRPDLSTVEDFWRLDIVTADTAFAALADAPERRIAAVEARIRADRDDLAPRAAREIGALRLLEIVASKVKTIEDSRSLSTWLRSALVEPSVVAEFLSSQSGGSWAILSAIAASIPPDSVPNDYGTDPWFLAVDAVARANRTNVPIFLDVPVNPSSWMAVAQSWRTREAELRAGA